MAYKQALPPKKFLGFAQRGEFMEFEERVYRANKNFILSQLRDMAIFQGSKDETVINGDKFTYRLSLYGMTYAYDTSVRESGDNVTLRIETERDNKDALTRQFELLEKFICQQNVKEG